MLTTEWGPVGTRGGYGAGWGPCACPWWQRAPVGTAWSNQVAPQPGQAQGPLIHSTPPLVPTGRGTHLSRFDCQTSSGRWGRKRSDGAITRFDCHHSVGTRGRCGAGWGPGACPGGNAIQWGFRGANRSPPNQDKHQAPSSTPPRPLSLQDPGPQASQWIGLPDSVVTIHQMAGVFRRWASLSRARDNATILADKRSDVNIQTT